MVAFSPDYFIAWIIQALGMPVAPTGEICAKQAKPAQKSAKSHCCCQFALVAKNNRFQGWPRKSEEWDQDKAPQRAVTNRRLKAIAAISWIGRISWR